MAAPDASRSGLDPLAELRQRRQEALAGAADLRQRVGAMLDPDSFVELDLFAGPPGDATRLAGAALAGFGAVGGRRLVLMAFDTGQVQASGAEAVGQKLGKAQEMALRSRVPLLTWLECRPESGTDLLSLAAWARLEARASELSGSVPQLCVVVGEPGPEAAKLARLHDFQVEPDGIPRLLAYLPAHADEAPPFWPQPEPQPETSGQLQDLLVTGGARSYELREVVDRVVDRDSYFPLGGGPGLAGGMARLGGTVVGVVAGTPVPGASWSDGEATFAARCVRFWDAFGMPILAVLDSAGSDTSQEAAAALTYAYTEAQVPKLTVVVGTLGGSAYSTLGAKQLGADLVVAWPTADFGSGPELGPGEQHAALERGWVDAVIEPAETRGVLLRGLEICLEKELPEPPRRHGTVV